MNPYDDTSVIHRLYFAVEQLVSAQPIQQRLSSAYTNYLFPLSAEDFPEQHQQEYAALEQAFTWLPPEGGGAGRGRSTLKHMSDEEAERWARYIVRLFAELSQGAS